MFPIEDVMFNISNLILLCNLEFHASNRWQPPLKPCVFRFQTLQPHNPQPLQIPLAMNRCLSMFILVSVIIFCQNGASHTLFSFRLAPELGLLLQISTTNTSSLTVSQRNLSNWILSGNSQAKVLPTHHQIFPLLVMCYDWLHHIYF